MNRRIRDFPWGATAAGAAVLAALHYAAQAAAVALGARDAGHASGLGTLPLVLVLGALVSVALTFVVAGDERVRTPGRALRRAMLFCVVPTAAIAGGAAAGDVDATRAVLGIAALVAGSLVTARLIAAREPERA